MSPRYPGDEWKLATPPEYDTQPTRCAECGAWMAGCYCLCELGPPEDDGRHDDDPGPWSRFDLGGEVRE